MPNHCHYHSGSWDEQLSITWLCPVLRFVLFIIIILSSCPTSLLAQSSMVLYNMRYVPQSHQLNPAQVPYMKWHVGMPALSGFRLGVGSTGFDYDRINAQIEADEADYSTMISPTAPAFNRGVLDFELQLLNFGFQFNQGQSYLSFDVADAFYASGNYTRDFAQMFDMIEKNQIQDAGSKTFDQSRQVLNMAYYRGYGLGYAQQINKKLSLGIRARYLQGILSLWSENEGLRFHYPGDGNSFEIQGRMNVLTAGRSLVDELDGVSSLFPAGNGGFAFDIGGLYQINDKWELSFAMQQLGQIIWKREVNNTVIGDQFTFSAVDIDDHMDTWSAVADSLLDGQGINTRARYTTPLPQRYFIGANYFFSPNSSIGILINPVNYYQATDLNLALAIQTRLGKILGVSAVFGHSRYANLNVGTGLSVELGPFQIYAVTEALFGSTSWRSAEMGQVQLGINLNFGRYTRSDLVQPDEREVLTDVALVRPDSSTYTLLDIPEGQFFQEDPVPTIPAKESTPSSSEEGKIKLNHVSPGYYLFSASCADLQSGLRVERAKYEIYTLAADGQKELFLIGSVMDGKLSVQLALDQLYVLKLMAQGYQVQEVVLRQVGVEYSQMEIRKGIRLVPQLPVASEQNLASEEDLPELPPKAELEKEEEATPPAKTVTPTPQPTIRPTTSSAAPVEVLPPFRIAKNTSLRRESTHTSGVILRLRTGDRVEVLEKTNKLWWKVRFKQREGYAKALLLEEL